MILYQGKLYDSREQNRLLASLPQHINQTRKTETLEAGVVIAALDILGKNISEGLFDTELPPYYLSMLTGMLKKEALLCKVETELGKHFFTSAQTMPPPEQPSITILPMPLGTLLHIAAGNMEGLPVFSVAEGLLTGNVNILKLPQADHGVSLKLLRLLIDIEPGLSDFIYAFDTPSTDVEGIRSMAGLADGIITWGGHEAVTAVRKFASPGTKLIEWGHKLSFAYISGYEHREQELTALAEHILMTKQLLCSSCQTIFLDTDQMDEVYLFCTEFLKYMELAAVKYPGTDMGISGELTLRKYGDTIDKILTNSKVNTEKVFQGKCCSLTALEDDTLELSYMFGHCLVKRLPQDKLFDALRKQKDYLQTAGLICEKHKRPSLTNLLARSGMVRIMTAGHMSTPFCGEAHDGEYALRRYVRMVNCEI